MTGPAHISIEERLATPDGYAQCPASTRCSTPPLHLDQHRLRGGAERTAARCGDGIARAATGHRRRGQRKDAHAHLPRRLSARERNRSAQHFVAHVYEQGRAPNARSRRESLAGRCERALGRNVSLHRKSHAAPARARARLFQRIHDHGSRRSEGFDQRCHRGGRNRSEGNAFPER